MSARPVPLERMIARSNNGKTLGKRDLVVNDVSAMEALEPPTPPAGLGDRGSIEWRKIWQAGRWLWPDQDYAWIEQVCHAYDDLETFRDQVIKDGLTVEGYAGQMTAHPLIREMRYCEETIRKCLSQLGFSPTDRARLKLTELRGASELQKLVNGQTGAPQTVRGEVEYNEGEW
jgi:P27 family predicted phage terminase small subunit